jgi:hypothetical protein
MLRQHIEAATPKLRAIQPVMGDLGPGGDTFQIFEPVGRHQNGAAWLIQPVIGPPDALQQDG